MKAIIFDFDGLIVDTETIWYEAYKEILNNHGLELSLEQFSKGVGTEDTELYKYIKENLVSPVDPMEIEGLVQELVMIKLGFPALREGVADYLKDAKELGLKIGLASSSSPKWVEGFLTKLNIIQYFDVIKTRDDVSEIKPSPELYIKAVEALGVFPSEAVAFEDSLNGLKAARSAGLHCVIVPNSVTAHLDFDDYSLRLSSMGEKALVHVLKVIGGKADKPNVFNIRLGTTADEDFLWEMLYQAIFIPEGEPRPSRDILKEPHIEQSLKGWGRNGDTALIAIDANNTPIGAVWVRLFDEENKTYGYMDNQTPLLGMALNPEYRGNGIGTALLGEMLRITKEAGFEAVSLSVDPKNPALKLYTRLGFKKVGIDGTSWDMIMKFNG